jgi:type IX secretion system PorP/SprF family membrane protein
MKHITHIVLVAIFIAIISATATAQQIPVRSNYLMSSFMDHPAAAGNMECLDMRLGHRNQWVGFADAPTNSFISLSGRLSESPRSVSGVGARVETDQAGPWGTTSLSFAYSHKLKLTSGAWLSAGAAMGVTQHRLNTGALDFPDVEASGDPAVAGTTQFLFPTVELGLWYQDKRSFGGISIVNATAATLSTITLGSVTSRCFIATVGTSMELDGRFMFRPSANMRVASGLPPSFEMNGAIVYDDLLVLGLGYRNGTAIIGSFQIALFDYMKLGYSYDFGISDIRIVSASSHEITIALSACDGSAPRAHQCPAYD